MYPIAVELLPVLFESNALNPNALLLDPVVFDFKALNPKALRLEVVDALRDKYPIAVLCPPLMLAASTGHEEAVQLLLALGAEADAASEEGWTALMLASQTKGNKYLSRKETKVFIGEKGLYPIYNYSTKSYRALPQNWAVTQDKRGILYFGNNEGIFSWKTNIGSPGNYEAIASAEGRQAS